MGSETSLLLPVLMAATLGAAEPGRPTLSGFVRNAEGKPIQGALVFVSTARPRQGTSTTCPSCYLDCRKRATTRADGAFEISSLDPSLLFQVGAAADGYVATFARDVDPSAGRLGLSLVPEPEAPSSPRQLMRGRIVDADGQPVVGALVDPIGYRLDGDGRRRRGAKVILEDGKPLPQKTRIAVSRLRAWDTVEAELSATGEFRLGPFPMESVELSIRVPGYELSTENASLLPAYDDSRTSLGGHLGRDTQLRIVLSPVRDRPRAKTPRTANEWTAFNAKAEAIRAKELQAAPIDK
jgi:hypothetical protein